MSTDNYLAAAESDAQSTVDEYTDAILEQLLDKGEASDDLLNDYGNGDAWHHESHVDKWYSLHDAAAVLDQLDEFEETNTGLWEGQDMKTALFTCAAFTYGNAVYSEWTDLIKRINEEADTIISDFDDQARDLETEIDDLRERAEAAEDEEEAEELGDEADRKQTELDDLEDEKKEALRKMIAEIAGN